MDSQDLQNLSEAYYYDVYQLDEKEDSPYEKASDAALDARYGYGRAQGDKRSFGRAANRASAAAMLRRLRRDRDEGRETSRESGADAVHQGWAHTARTSADQTPEKRERRAKLADTPYSQLPDDEKEKDRVSADAVRALYNRRNQREETDLFDYFLEYLVAEGYADTNDNALVIMANMSEQWRESILDEAYVDYKTGRLPSGRTPQQAAQSKADLLNAKERNRPIGQLDGTWGRQQHQDRITKEMGAHTAGNPVSRAVRRGLGNMLPGGEPSTDRHIKAMDRRKRVADVAAAEKKSRG